MRRTELAETLASLVEGVQAPPEAGLLITEADLEIPLEIYSGVRDDKLVFYGAPPHSRWQAGFLPAVHFGRLHVTLESGSEKPVTTEYDASG